MLAAKPKPESNDSTLQSWQNRVLDERNDLDGKIQRLTTFLSQDAYRQLPEAEQRMLTKQRKFMLGYLSVLDERIFAWKGSWETPDAEPIAEKLHNLADSIIENAGITANANTADANSVPDETA